MHFIRDIGSWRLNWCISSEMACVILRLHYKCEKKLFAHKQKSKASINRKQLNEQPKLHQPVLRTRQRRTAGTPRSSCLGSPRNTQPYRTCNKIMLWNRIRIFFKKGNRMPFEKILIRILSRKKLIRPIKDGVRYYPWKKGGSETLNKYPWN